MNLFCRDSARKLDAFLFRNVPPLFFKSFRKVRVRFVETEISLARWNVDFSVLSPIRGIYIVLAAFSNRRDRFRPIGLSLEDRTGSFCGRCTY